MCGRYATTRSSADLSALFDAVDETGDGLAADYNVAPTDPVPIVRRSRRVDGPVLSVARWGLVPAWAADTSGAARMINARAETVATAPAYATSFASRRCLVPADGWYEWVRLAPKQRQPYFMTRSDGGVLALAGIWTVWGDHLLTCSIVTTGAVGELSLVHNRMPVVVPDGRWQDWLGGDVRAASTLLAPPASEALPPLELRPVGRAVGDVRNDGPGLVERVAAPPLGVSIERPAELTLFD
jgi:putative SOS response-associated peptidase YedK